MKWITTLTAIYIAELCILFTPAVVSTDVGQANVLYSAKLKDYNKHLLPVLDDNSTSTIGVDVQISSLNNFDEMSGELTVAMLFIFEWREERITWSPSDYGGKTSLFVSPYDIWRPQIYVIESSKSLQDLTNHSLMVRIRNDGSITWSPGHILQVTCSVDVTYFPFDSQKCLITLAGWAYETSEVVLHAASQTLSTNYYKDNGQWELLPSSMSNCTLFEGPTCIYITISLRRRSLFYVIYLLIPICFLSVINNFVFFMPASSGERTSVAITTFLSFIVYMGIVNDTVPESSSPIAYLYFYLLFLMAHSSTIMFLCIVSLRIYSKTSIVPHHLQQITKFLRWYCVVRKSNNIKVSPKIRRKSSEDNVPNIEMNTFVDQEEEGQCRLTSCEDETEITWNLIGKTFDFYCAFIVFLGYVVFTGNVFTNLYMNISLT